MLKVALMFVTMAVQLGRIMGQPSTGNEATDYQVRLMNGVDQMQGRVEVLIGGHWGTVCDDWWSDADAAVVCRMLGVSTVAATAFSNAHFGLGSGSILLDNVNCVGNETNLAQCPSNLPGQHNCGHSEDAGVQCYALCQPIPIPNDGTVSPPSCTTGTTEQGMKCNVICNAGFTTVTPKLTCLGNGLWSSNGAPITCRDTQPPTLHCPQNQQLTVPQGQQTFNVTWPAPTASDNSGVAPSLFQSRQSGVTLGSGVYMVNVVAIDGSGLSSYCSFTVMVTVLRCPELTSPNNGFIVTGSCPDYYGATCRIACDPGYTINSTGIVTCSVDANNRPIWTGHGFTCQALFCQPIPIPQDGTLSPPSCTTGMTKPGTKCNVRCNAGFTTVTPKLTCLGNGLWSSYGAPITCRDTQPPTMHCPQNQQLTAPEGQQTFNVTWPAPTASDNSGVAPSLFQSRQSGMTLGAGVYMVNVIATDGSGLSSYCSFTVTVTAGGSAASDPSNLSTDTMMIGVGIVVLICLSVGAIFLYMRRMRMQLSSKFYLNDPRTTNCFGNPTFTTNNTS